MSEPVTARLRPIPTVPVSMAPIVVGGRCGRRSSGVSPVLCAATLLVGFACSAVGQEPSTGDRGESGPAGARPTEQDRELLYAAMDHNDAGRGDSALALLRALAERRAPESWGAEASLILGELGRAHFGLGRLDSALVHFDRALGTSERAEDIRWASLNLGATYRALGRPDSAFHYYGRAREAARSVGDLLGVAESRNDEGVLHEEIATSDGVAARYDSALAAYRAALSASEAAPPAADRFEREQWAWVRGDAHNGIGVVHRRLGHPDSALAHYRHALTIQDSIGDGPGRSMSLHNIGLVHADLARPDSARAYLSKALRGWRELGFLRWEAESLYELGAVHHRAVEPPRLETALAYYDSSAAAFRRMWERSGDDANRLGFGDKDTIRRLFADWALAQLAAGTRPQGSAGGGPGGAEPSLTPEDAAFAALAATERGRAQALLALMGAPERRRAPAAGGSDRPEATVASRLAAEGRRLAERVAVGGTRVLVYAVTPDTLVSWLVQPGGRLEVRRVPVGRGELAALVGNVRTGLAAAGAPPYAVPDAAADRAEPAVEAPAVEAPAAEAASLAASLDRKAGGGSRGSETVGGADLDPEEALIRLSELLVPEDPSGGRAGGSVASGDLVIVPAGVLSLLPFGALPAGEAGEPLGTRLALRFAPSLAALAAVRGTSGGAGAPDVDLQGPEILVVGDPPAPIELGLPRLPGAAAEAAWVASELGTEPLLGEAASEAAVRARLPGAPIVHLATHGLAYSTDARARRTFVALASDSTHDGYLTVGEILDDGEIALTAELVVLSACQTALGNLTQAEGTVGLQRAFLAKGARSVIVTLWNVSDAATAALMRRFYRHWREDGDRPDKAEALRRAQADLWRGEEGDEFRDARYWAAFQLVGAR